MRTLSSGELERALWPYLRTVHAAVDRAAPGFVDQQASFDALYLERDRLFPIVSPHLRRELEGGGPVGRAALRHELSYLRTSLLGQVRAVERGLQQVAENVAASPVTTTWRVLQVLLVVLIFRGWRRWSKEGLVSARSRLLKQTPTQAVNFRIARVLWYLHRVNGPLTWLVLVFALSRLVMPRGFEEIAGLVYTILFWILVARLAVLLIDAMAVRGVGGGRSERRALRLRTLRLIAAWSVLLGLGLGLVGRYVGHGSMYAWGVRIWQVLSVPAVLLVVHWWRAEIFERLEELSDHSDWARRLASNRKGFWSFPAAVLGAAFLVWAKALRWMVQRLSRFEAGRRGLAVLVRRQVEQEATPTAGSSERALTADVKEQLLSAGELLLESVAREPLDSLCLTLNSAHGGGYVVRAPRGGGKSTFLHRLGAALGNEMRIVDCPPGGYEAFEAALATELGLSPSEMAGEALTEAVMAAGIRVLAIDDAHRLARPYMGGQESLDRIAELDARLGGRVSWVLSMDGSAWSYILLARGERALFQRVVALPRWSEEQLGELVEARCKLSNVHPDYTRFVLPRQLDTGDHESLAERNRFGYARILWELADGNPEVAMRLFTDSLRCDTSDRVIAHLPQARFSATLNDAGVETLLVLRVVLQCDIARIEDISQSLRISAARAEAGIRFCLQNEWLEEVDGGLRSVRWDWYPTVTRLLERKNLLPR